MVRLALRLSLLALIGALLLGPVAGAGPGTREGRVTGQLVELHRDVVGGEPIPGYGLDTGRRMRSLGARQPQRLVGQRVAVEDASNVAGLQGQAQPTTGTRTLVASGPAVRKTAIVLVNFANDTSEPITPTQARDRMFTGADSVKQFYEEQSGGDVTLGGIQDAGGDVLGWWTLPMSKTTTCSDQSMFDIANAAYTYANGQGVNLGAYDHVVLYFKRNTACAWAGLGQLPGEWSWINGYDDTSVIAHEIGHNMGAHHAASLTCGGSALTASTAGCSSSEYGDGYDVMGSSSALMSSWHRAQIGQLPLAARQTVTESGSYALDDANDVLASNPRLLLIPRQIAGQPVSQYFAVELRSAYGAFDTFGPSAPQVTGVTIRLVPDLSVIDVSKLLDMHPGTGGFTNSPLQPGETFTDPGSGLAITNVATASGTATLSVTTTASDATPPSAPALTATAGQDGVGLSWTAATDENGIDHYEVRRDGTPVAVTPAGTRTYTDVPETGAVSATYQVIAYDAAGNAAASAAVEVALPDVTAPVMAYLAADRLADGGVRLSVAATDDRGVAGYEIARVGRTAWTTAGPWVDTDAPATGTEYTVRAVDAAGNRSAPMAVTSGPAATGSGGSGREASGPEPDDGLTLAPVPRPRVIVRPGRGGRFIVLVPGATTVSVRAGAWRASVRGPRLSARLPQRLRSARRVPLELRAVVGTTAAKTTLVARRGVVGTR